MSDPYNDEPEEEIIYVSKSEIKRDMDELKKLGEELVNMPAKNRDKIPMDDELSEAIELAIRIRNKREGFRRHMQFVGKLLRSKDVEAIRKALLKIKESHLIANQHFHMLEEKRDELIAQGDAAIQTLLEQHPDLDRSKLRQLVRQANKEKANNKTPKAARQLYQYLQDAIPHE